MSDELNLYVVRHCETEGNVNRELYKTKADHAIRLTPRGVEQAQSTGEFLAAFLRHKKESSDGDFGNIRVYYSPYYRTRETARHILYPLGQAFDVAAGEVTYRESPFLYEQKAGLFDGLEDDDYATAFPKEAADYAKHCLYNGRVYAPAPLGESRMDTALRAKQSFATIQKHWKRRNIRHAILVTHGVTVRAITMAWKHYAPEWFDAEKNPGNGWVRFIHGSAEKGYSDEGYIFGENAPFNDPKATQRELKNAEAIYMLAPQVPGILVPPGVLCVNPFAPE